MPGAGQGSVPLLLVYRVISLLVGVPGDIPVAAMAGRGFHPGEFPRLQGAVGKQVFHPVDFTGNALLRQLSRNRFIRACRRAPYGERAPFHLYVVVTPNTFPVGGVTMGPRTTAIFIVDLTEVALRFG